MKEIYNNGALKIEYTPESGIYLFILRFNCADVKKDIFLTEEQFSIMKAALSVKETPEEAFENIAKKWENSCREWNSWHFSLGRPDYYLLNEEKYGRCRIKKHLFYYRYSFKNMTADLNRLMLEVIKTLSKKEN